MAALASVTRKEITGNLGQEIVRGTVTTSGDTFASRFGTIQQVFIHDETTLGGARATFSGSTVTITCTAADVVDLMIVGR